MEKDVLKKWFLCDSRVLLTVAKTTNMVNKANKLHSLTPTTSAVLGRMLTMGALMGAKLKNKDDNITSTIVGDGPVGRVVCVAKYNGIVKGYLDNPSVDLMPNVKGKLDVAGAVGKGKLRVISDVGFGTPYLGEINLVSGEIAEDFANYYATSLQQPCAIALGVLVDKNCHTESAGGFLIEVMPDATEEDINILEEKTKTLSDLSKILKDITLDEFVDKYFGNLSPKCYDEIEPFFKCDCSKARVVKAIKLMKQSETEDLFKDGEIEVVCDFCNKKRKIVKEDIEK